VYKEWHLAMELGKRFWVTLFPDGANLLDVMSYSLGYGFIHSLDEWDEWTNGDCM